MPGSTTKRLLTGCLAFGTVVMAGTAMLASGQARAADAPVAASPPSAADAATGMTDFAPSASFRWNQMTLAAIRHELSPRPPVVARSLFIVHQAEYEAWAAYDPKAAGQITGQKLDTTGTKADQERAVSLAAYLAIQNQFPGFEESTRAGNALLKRYGGALKAKPAPGSPDAVASATVKAVLASRQRRRQPERRLSGARQ